MKKINNQTLSDKFTFDPVILLQNKPFIDPPKRIENLSKPFKLKSFYIP
jgi:hypothetical protein